MRFQFFELTSGTPAPASSGGSSSSSEQQLTTCGVMHSSETWPAPRATLGCLVTLTTPGLALTIEAGTDVVATSTQGGLVIGPGARLVAEGTADKPVTFRGGGSFASSVPTTTTFGLWTGIFLLGNAPVYGGSSSTIAALAAYGTSFGGSVVDDDSGVLRYVRVYDCGAAVGFSEPAALTLGAVGRGTKLEHVELAFAADDGLQFVGGTVDVKFISALWIGDDAIDVDDGYQGRIQFFFALVDGDVGNHAVEADSNFDAAPRSFFSLYSATILVIETTNPRTDALVRLKNGVGAELVNVVAAVAGGSSNQPSSRPFLAEAQCSPSVARFQDDVLLKARRAGQDTNYLYVSPNNVVAPSLLVDRDDGSCLGLTFAAISADPALARLPSATLLDAGQAVDPRPTPGSLAFVDVDVPPSDGFFDATTYKGAFGPDAKDFWLAKWSWLDDADKLDIYRENLPPSSNGGAVPVPPPTPRPSVAPSLEEEQTAAPNAACSKSQSKATSSAGVVAAITFFLGLLVGAGLLAAFSAIRRGDHHNGGFNFFKASARHPDPRAFHSTNGRRRRPNRYEAFGVELVEASDDVSFS